MDQTLTLFEVSWEVGHKVGGIHTVVSTKARNVGERLDGRHVLVGPWLDDHRDGCPDLEPTPEHAEFVQRCADAGLPVCVGRWNVPGRPLTILVRPNALVDEQDDLLARTWEEHRVDSLLGAWEYVEPFLFGFAAGRVVELWWTHVAEEHGRAVVQCHEWMTGTSLLHIHDQCPAMGTVFTTHATVLGRSVAGRGRDPERVLDGTTIEDLAAEFGVRARHSLEAVTARTADVHTAVSAITSAESELFHGRAADVVLPNGLDAQVMEARRGGVDRATAAAALRGLAAERVRDDVSDALLLGCSGRYEVHNKGYDVLLDAAAAMNAIDGPRVVLFLCVPTGHSGLCDDASPDGVSLHQIEDPNDAIATQCAALGLDNAPGSRVKIVHWAEYVAAGDDVLGISHEAVLGGMDLTCFPSYYEAWGYTPQESLALGVPTVTTDCAGFALWARERGLGPQQGVHILDRHGNDDDGRIAADLAALLERLVREPSQLREADCETAGRATLWDELADHHQAAWTRAAAAAAAREEHCAEVRADLAQIAANWCWTWDPEAWELFRAVDAERFTALRHDAVRLLAETSNGAVCTASQCEDLRARVTAVRARTDRHLNAPAADLGIDPEHPVAYVCAEFAIHESMPLYSGGLGVLAGDHLRAASDLALPLVAVGLLYRDGYMAQTLTNGVTQSVTADPFAPDATALELVRDLAGEPIEVAVGLCDGPVRLRIWRADVGRVPLYLLDAVVEGNRDEDRTLTARLYSGDHEHRLRQEIVLGIGGTRALAALGIEPGAFHINEGHGAFVALERTRVLMADDGRSFDDARARVGATTIFTTHTPVAAGHDAFDGELMRRQLPHAGEKLGLSWEAFLALGASATKPDLFSMTGLAFRFADAVNGVSQKHADISRGLLHAYCPETEADDVPVFGVTNGVHLGTWTAPETRALLDAEPGDALGPRFAEAGDLDDGVVWSTRNALRTRFLTELAARLERRLPARGDSRETLEAVLAGLDPNALTIGFARRFATYKRAGLFLSDPDRLARLLSDDDCPVRIFVAGKAHPADTQGQELLANVARLSRTEPFLGRIVVVEGYDMQLARLLVQGVDVWLNTPRPPMEASGTSGMKSAANGGLNLSVGDGWWLEGYDGVNGWRIGTGEEPEESLDEQHAEHLYRLLETEVVPEFFGRDDEGIPRRWTARVRRALTSLPSVFDTRRMVSEYAERAYAPAAARDRALRSRGA